MRLIPLCWPVVNCIDFYFSDCSSDLYFSEFYFPSSIFRFVFYRFVVSELHYPVCIYRLVFPIFFVWFVFSVSYLPFRIPDLFFQCVNFGIFRLCDSYCFGLVFSDLYFPLCISRPFLPTYTFRFVFCDFCFPICIVGCVFVGLYFLIFTFRFISSDLYFAKYDFRFVFSYLLFPQFVCVDVYFPTFVSDLYYFYIFPPFFQT